VPLFSCQGGDGEIRDQLLIGIGDCFFVPGTHLLAPVTAEDYPFCLPAEFFRYVAIMFYGEVGNATAGIYCPVFADGPGGAGIDAKSAIAAPVTG